LQAGDRTVITDPAETAMLDYVEKLTREPSSVSQADVSGLRDQGFADADVLDIAQIAAYYAFVNRIAEGLGVELESHRS
jgi:uncharacterized peroxidase-related enzyme